MPASNITSADIAAASTEELINGWCYSDAHKAVYNFRPKGEHAYTRDAVVSFWEGFNTAWANMEQEENEYLAHLCKKHGIEFKSLSDYYTWYEKKEYAEHCARMDAEDRREAKRQRKAAEYARRASLVDAIVDWDFGKFGNKYA